MRHILPNAGNTLMYIYCKAFLTFVNLCKYKPSRIYLWGNDVLISHNIREI